jgi:hypothetical protein
MKPRASVIYQLPIHKIITMCNIVNTLVENLFLTDEKIFLKVVFHLNRDSPLQRYLQL